MRAENKKAPLLVRDAIECGTDEERRKLFWFLFSGYCVDCFGALDGGPCACGRRLRANEIGETR